MHFVQNTSRRLLLKAAMTVQRLRYLCAEIYKTKNSLNPRYMKNVFKKSDTVRSKRAQHQNNLIVLDQIIMNLAQNVLLLVDQKFVICFLLILSPQKRLKCLKNLSKHGTEKCVSVVCAHITRIIKSCENE